MAIFTGAGVALITPMKEDLSVDYDQLERVIDDQINHGTDSIIICGTTGEASTMSHKEQIEVVAACVSCVNKRVPVMPGQVLIAQTKPFISPGSRRESEATGF